jgi:N-acetyl sugar amidotransferase
MLNNERLETKYGLPADVIFCNKCVMSNQRATTTREFNHSVKTKHQTMAINENGECDACRYAKKKEEIDWKSREDELLKLLDRYRRKDGQYDCIVPGSGGKDSGFAAHVLKYKYDMHPLTVTWPPILYTDIGVKNFRNWLKEGGFPNITYNYNPKTHALLTKLAIERLLHPFQPFILGQKNIAPKIALKYNIPLIFYGENESEYGSPIAMNQSSLRDKAFYTFKNLEKIYLGGVSCNELFDKYKLNLNDILDYLPPNHKEVENSNIEYHYLGYYIKWTPQEVYYYAVENTGFEANHFRSEGTYTNHNSLDDKIDGLHYYTTFIKFGMGRATWDASKDIRNRHITREEGVALVNKFDGEFPENFFREIMEYIGMEPERFIKLCDQARSPHLWEYDGNAWRLRNQIL